MAKSLTPEQATRRAAKTIKLQVGVFTITPHADGSLEITRHFNGFYNFKKPLIEVTSNDPMTAITVKPIGGCVPASI